MGAPKRNDLSVALFGKTRRTVLALFFARPDESFYLRQIARLAGVGPGAIQRELGRLAEAGIINRSARDRVVEYRANRKCPIFAELEGLIRKTAGLAGVLREALGPLSREIDLAFVYGSHAAGTAGAASDVDVLIVGEADELAIHRALVKAELRLSRPVNYVLFSRKELQNRRKEKGGFLARVLSGPKIPIVEDSRDV